VHAAEGVDHPVMIVRSKPILSARGLITTKFATDWAYGVSIGFGTGV
jgi:hypothetical protein